MRQKAAPLPQECDSIRANNAQSVANLEEGAKKMRDVAEEFSEIGESLTRHLKRLEEGDDEVTPPPFPLPFAIAKK
jgi:predicted ribosome quality control (RQC) complex YloA/Tae2 family protein